MHTILKSLRALNKSSFLYCLVSVVFRECKLYLQRGFHQESNTFFSSWIDDSQKFKFFWLHKEDKIEYQLQYYELQPLMTFKIQIGSQFHVSSDCADGNSHWYCRSSWKKKLHQFVHFSNLQEKGNICA